MNWYRIYKIAQLSSLPVLGSVITIPGIGQVTIKRYTPNGKMIVEDTNKKPFMVDPAIFIDVKVGDQTIYNDKPMTVSWIDRKNSKVQLTHYISTQSDLIEQPRIITINLADYKKVPLKPIPNGTEVKSVGQGYREKIIIVNRSETTEERERGNIFYKVWANGRYMPHISAAVLVPVNSGVQ